MAAPYHSSDYIFDNICVIGSAEERDVVSEVVPHVVGQRNHNLLIKVFILRENFPTLSTLVGMSWHVV